MNNLHLIILKDEETILDFNNTKNKVSINLQIMNQQF